MRTVQMYHSALHNPAQYAVNCSGLTSVVVRLHFFAGNEEWRLAIDMACNINTAVPVRFEQAHHFASIENLTQKILTWAASLEGC